MMEARVAGVPIPFPFKLSRSSSSCNSLPQCSIAERRLLSVCRGRGLVCFSTHSADCRGKTSSVCKVGKAAVPSSSSSRSFRTARHPADLTTVPLAVNTLFPAVKETVVASLRQRAEKASSRRAATMSYTVRSSADSSPGRHSVMMSAWWSVTFPASTLRRLSEAPFRAAAWAAKAGYRPSRAIRSGISSNTSSDR